MRHSRKSHDQKQSRACCNAALIYSKYSLSTKCRTYSPENAEGALHCDYVSYFQQALQRTSVHHRLLLRVKCYRASGTHGGLSFDTNSLEHGQITGTHQELTKCAKARNKHLPCTMFIYNNFDMVAQPTTRKTGSHTSMTSAVG
jgi:hypothetical protein